jgi:hypothetical protein
VGGEGERREGKAGWGRREDLSQEQKLLQSREMDREMELVLDDVEESGFDHPSDGIDALLQFAFVAKGHRLDGVLSQDRGWDRKVINSWSCRGGRFVAKFGSCCPWGGCGRGSS